MTWAIKDWRKTFESAASRKVGELTYLGRWPLGMNSRAFRRLMKTAAGCMAFGHFCAIVQVAARCQPRGTLARDGADLTAEEIAEEIRTPLQLFQKSWAILVSAPIGWLVPTTTPAKTHDDPNATPEQHQDDPTTTPAETSGRAGGGGGGGVSDNQFKDEEEEGFGVRVRGKPTGARAGLEPTPDESAMAVWAGRSLRSDERRKLVEVVVSVQRQPAATIHGKPMSRIELWRKCLAESTKSGTFNTAGSALAYIASMAERCVDQECLPGEWPTKANGQAPSSAAAVDAALAAEKARRAKP